MVIKIQCKRLEVEAGCCPDDPKDIAIEGIIPCNKSYNLNLNAEEMVVMDGDEYHAMTRKISECENRLPLIKAFDDSDIYVAYDLDRNRSVCRLHIPSKFETFGAPEFTIMFNDKTIRYVVDNGDIS